MNKDDCIFCKIASGTMPSTKVYEDDQIIAFLDIGPISDGHTLVVPKQHYEKLHKCPAELMAKIGLCIGRIAGAVAEATNAEGYNVLCNNGRAAGQLVDHLHFHIIPRHSKDGVFNRWPAYTYPEGKIAEIADGILKKLEKIPE